VFGRSGRQLMAHDPRNSSAGSRAGECMLDSDVLHVGSGVLCTAGFRGLFGNSRRQLTALESRCSSAGECQYGMGVPLSWA
jgi:hypothetical protein